jgi:excisionase family DNA binding protein
MTRRDVQLLTTGEAARIIGCTRQHVVDLCDRGSLNCERTPVHRRLDRSEVEEFVRRRKGLRREELRSLWINRAVAARIARDPERVLALARRNLERFDEIHAGSGVRHWLRRWRKLLSEGPENVMETLTSTSQDAAELRQNSPFPGVLSESERSRILRSFAKHYDRTLA